VLQACHCYFTRPAAWLISDMIFHFIDTEWLIFKATQICRYKCPMLYIWPSTTCQLDVSYILASFLILDTLFNPPCPWMILGELVVSEQVHENGTRKWMVEVVFSVARSSWLQLNGAVGCLVSSIWFSMPMVKHLDIFRYRVSALVSWGYNVVWHHSKYIKQFSFKGTVLFKLNLMCFLLKKLFCLCIKIVKMLFSSNWPIFILFM
jgi:hypothetical protein